MDLRNLSDEEFMQLTRAEAECQSVNAGRKPDPAAFPAPKDMQRVRHTPEPVKPEDRRSAHS